MRNAMCPDCKINFHHTYKNNYLFLQITRGANIKVHSNIIIHLPYKPAHG